MKDEGGRMREEGGRMKEEGLAGFLPVPVPPSSFRLHPSSFIFILPAFRPSLFR